MDNEIVAFLCSIFLAVFVVTAPVLVLYILPCIAIVEMRNTRERAASQAHKRMLELMDKQIELERVLRMPPATAIDGVLDTPSTELQTPTTEEVQ